MILLNLLFIFWLYNIQQNKQLREAWNLHCSEFRLGQDIEASFLLYSCILNTGPSFELCCCSGLVFTPFGFCKVEVNPVRLMLDRTEYNIHLKASKRLMRMLRLMTMSSSILLPRLFPGVDRKHWQFRTNVLMHLMRKITHPTIWKTNSFNGFSDSSYSFTSGWRMNLLVVSPLDSKVSACSRSFTAAANPCDAIFRHQKVCEAIIAFLQSNKDFPLNYGELIKLLHWAFMHQEGRRKMNARMFEMQLSDITSSQILGMTPEKIFQDANRGNLLTLAIRYYVNDKERTRKM
jgi:hypothetical protein